MQQRPGLGSWSPREADRFIHSRRRPSAAPRPKAVAPGGGLATAKAKGRAVREPARSVHASLRLQLGMNDDALAVSGQSFSA